jgi:hypothetical protein
MLHFEIHGLDDESGFSMANAETVVWEDLAAPFEAVNHASRNNVVVVLATCSGTHLAVVMPRRRAPFWGLVAPNGPVTAGRLLSGMRAFYDELLSSQDGSKAVEALNLAGAEEDPTVAYKWRSAEGVFRDYYREIIRSRSSARARQEATEKKLSEVMATTLGRRAGLAKARRIVKHAAKAAPEKAFPRVRDRYLMLDDFPGERARFTLLYEQCIPTAP